MLLLLLLTSESHSAVFITGRDFGCVMFQLVIPPDSELSSSVNWKLLKIMVIVVD